MFQRTGARYNQSHTYILRTTELDGSRWLWMLGIFQIFMGLLRGLTLLLASKMVNALGYSFITETALLQTSAHYWWFVFQIVPIALSRQTELIVQTSIWSTMDHGPAVLYECINRNRDNRLLQPRRQLLTRRQGELKIDQRWVNELIRKWDKEGWISLPTLALFNFYHSLR
jgi:hypothetical protein